MGWIGSAVWLIAPKWPQDLIIFNCPGCRIFILCEIHCYPGPPFLGYNNLVLATVYHQISCFFQSRSYQQPTTCCNEKKCISSFVKNIAFTNVAKAILKPHWNSFVLPILRDFFHVSNYVIDKKSSVIINNDNWIDFVGAVTVWQTGFRFSLSQKVNICQRFLKIYPYVKVR